MTRDEAEKQILEHLVEIVKIAQQFDPNTNYINVWAFAKTNAGMVTNNKSGKFCIDRWTDNLIEAGK